MRIMKIVFLIIVFFHGLIHLLGFIKGFGLKEVKELTLPISKPMGLVWLTATALFLSYGILYNVNLEYAWLIGLISVLMSQILIIIFWKDARFGTILNIIILIVTLISFGLHSFQKLVHQETSQILSQNKILDEKVITEDAIMDLPKPVKNWLRHSGAVGKPYMHVGKIIQKAEMKMKPDQINWIPATAIQYTTIDNPAFIWTVDVKMNSFLNFRGRDKFENGKGEMLIKLNSLFNVVNEKGIKMDESTAQRYLGEVVWFPSLALSPYISWEPINDTTARAILTYKGTNGSGTFYFNSEGDVIKYSALRYKDNEVDAKREEWVMSIDNYKVFENIRVPAIMTATWKLNEGDWTWLKLEVLEIKYNRNARLNPA
jgi:Family of unknown function (DUF6544)